MSKKLLLLCTAFLIGGASDAATVFQLEKAVPLKSEQVRITRLYGAKEYHFSKQSTLHLPFQARKMEQGTILMAFTLPEDFRTQKNAGILFQLGSAPWGKNGIILMHDGKRDRMILSFSGQTGRAYREIPASAFHAGKRNCAAFSWNAREVEFFFNGIYGGKNPQKGGITFPETVISLGGNASRNPANAVSGAFSFIEIQDARQSKEAILGQMWNITGLPPEKKTAKGKEKEPQPVMPPAPPSEKSAPYIEEKGDTVRIGGSRFELQVTKSGIPIALYGKNAKRFLIESWAGKLCNSWWTIQGSEGFDNRVTLIRSASCKARFKQQNGTAVWEYAIPENGSVFTVRVKPETDGTLRFGYSLKSGFGQPVKFIHFPVFGVFPKGKECWAVVPHYIGLRKNLKNSPFHLEYGGPGHLAMMLLGIEFQDTALLLYPRDPSGHVKFGSFNDYGSGKDGFFSIGWQNRDWVLPGEHYTANHDFVLEDAGRGLRGIAEHYRAWAKKQPWFVTCEEKLKKYPETAKVLNGVVKMTGFETLQSRGYNPSVEDKDKKCPLTYNYKRFLEIAEKTEKTYGVKPAYRYDGWWGRFDSRYPSYFPVDPRMGNFKEFAAANKAAGRLVYLHTNPIQYDFQSPKFDIKKMMRGPNGKYSPVVWSGNRLYTASPRPIIGDETEMVRTLTGLGICGLFEDVIGATTVCDTNPNGGYPYLWRDSGTIAMLELCKALREASGTAFRGTEEGEERRLPYYDAFMMAAGRSKEQVPFFAMVYGNCFINVIPIGGGGLGEIAIDRAKRMLSGVVLGVDGRSRGSVRCDNYSPSVQMTFETQKVLKHVAGKRILDYRNQGDAWLSVWKNAFTVANLGNTVLPEVEFEDPAFGKVAAYGLEPLASVHMNQSGAFAVWGIRRLVWNGTLIFDLKDAVKTTAVVFDGSCVSFGNTGEHPVKISAEIPAAPEKGMTERRPSGTTGAFSGKTPFRLDAGEVVFMR